MNPVHRKSIKHFDGQGTIHELTFTCFQHRCLLERDEYCKLLDESMERACERQQFERIAYVFMPNHVHLIVRAMTGESTISHFLRAIKRPFSYRLKLLLEQDHPELFEELIVRQRPGVMTFRFWQEGPGYDRNITEEKSLERAIEYIHLNPVRKKLVERATDWKWSSIHWFIE